MAKKSKVDLGKGLRRIYFTASAIWMLAWALILFQDAPGYPNAVHDIIIPGLFFFGVIDNNIIIPGLFLILAPVLLYFILLFFIKGFKK